MDDAVVQCTQCPAGNNRHHMTFVDCQYLCRDHAKAHQKNRATNNHKVIQLLPNVEKRRNLKTNPFSSSSSSSSSSVGSESTYFCSDLTHLEGAPGEQSPQTSKSHKGLVFAIDGVLRYKRERIIRAIQRQGGQYPCNNA